MIGVRIADGVIAKRVGEEMVLLDYERGIYYGLNPVGARVWQLVSEGEAIDPLIDCLAGEFDVTRETLETDVSRLVGELASNGLLRLDVDH